MIIPCKDDAFYIFRSDRDFSASTHLCINTSRAFPDSLRTCFCLGDVSSTLVAFLMFSVNSFSAFSRSTGRVGRWSSKRGLKERRILALVKKKDPCGPHFRISILHIHLLHQLLLLSFPSYSNQANEKEKGKFRRILECRGSVEIYENLALASKFTQ